MLSRFDTINERQGAPYQPAAIRLADVAPLAQVCAALAQDYLTGPEWTFTVHEGGVSFEHQREHHRLVRVFVDVDGRLTVRLQAGRPLGAQPRSADVRETGETPGRQDPVVVGLELSEENPFVREQIRDWLRREFPEQYVDPTQGGAKIRLQPDLDAYYDVLLIANPNRCPANEALAARYRDNIENVLAEIAERRTA